MLSGSEVERLPPASSEEVSTGWGRVPFSRLFARADKLPKLGTSRSVRKFIATVLDVTADGRPSPVRFVFAAPLESNGRERLMGRRAFAESFELPAVGASVTLARVSPLDLARYRSRRGSTHTRLATALATCLYRKLRSELTLTSASRYRALRLH